MIVLGIFIPRRPIIAGALAVPIGLSLVRTDLGPWLSSPAALFLLTCSPWWLGPMLVGALYGGIIGVITGLVFSENVETYGDNISVASAIITMLLVGACVWLIKTI